MVNFGPLVAEIVSLVWGTPGNFNGFRVLAALLHGTLVVGVSQTAALTRGRHLYSTGRPSRWALAHISSWFCEGAPCHQQKKCKQWKVLVPYAQLWCPMWIYEVQMIRYDCSQERVASEIPKLLLRQERRMLWSTESNDALRSKEMTWYCNRVIFLYRKKNIINNIKNLNNYHLSW